MTSTVKQTREIHQGTSDMQGTQVWKRGVSEEGGVRDSKNVKKIGQKRMFIILNVGKC